jgi:hypothetical protein
VELVLLLVEMVEQIQYVVQELMALVLLVLHPVVVEQVDKVGLDQQDWVAQVAQVEF